MQNWKYTFCCGSIKDEGIFNSSSSSWIWNKHKKDTKTPMDTINEYGAAGWELVAVTPIATDTGDAYAGITHEVLFTFKKPID